MIKEVSRLCNAVLHCLIEPHYMFQRPLFSSTLPFLFVWIQWISALSSIFVSETESSSEREGLASSLGDVDKEPMQCSRTRGAVCFELRHCFDKEGMCVLSPVCITETKHVMWPISDFIQVFHHFPHRLDMKHFSSSFSLFPLFSYSGLFSYCSVLYLMSIQGSGHAWNIVMNIDFMGLLSSKSFKWMFIFIA